MAKYSVQFGLMAVAAGVCAWAGAEGLVWRIVLSWVAAAFGVVAAAYALRRPRLLMKRSDGTQPIFAWVVLWPYFLLGRLSFLVYRLVRRRDVAIAEAAPGVWFARRLTAAEARRCGVQWVGVLDLAAEFPRVMADTAEYRSLPMLDGAAPSDAQLHDAVAWIDERVRHGKVLVHCALGHGRTGAVILSWLLVNGQVRDADEGVRHLTARRSTFGMSRAQLAAVGRFVTGVGKGERTRRGD